MRNREKISKAQIGEVEIRSRVFQSNLFLPKRSLKTAEKSRQANLQVCLPWFWCFVATC